jgi:hypothetical protein
MKIPSVRRPSRQQRSQPAGRDLPLSDKGGQRFTQAIVARENASADQIVLGETLGALGLHLAMNGPGGEFIYLEPGYTALVDAVAAGGVPRRRRSARTNINDTENFTTFVREMSKHTTVTVDEAEERDKPAIWRLGVDPRGMSFTGSLQNATHRHQIGRGRPIGECPPTGFGRRCLSTSVRLSSSTPSEYRQRIAKIPVILT